MWTWDLLQNIKTIQVLLDENKRKIGVLDLKLLQANEI